MPNLIEQPMKENHPPPWKLERSADKLFGVAIVIIGVAMTLRLTAFILRWVESEAWMAAKQQRENHESYYHTEDYDVE